MVLKSCKSSIQLGFFLSKFTMNDPLPNPIYDSLFDILLLLTWIIVIIFFIKSNNQIHAFEKKIKQYTIFYGLISYIIGSIISYVIYYFLDDNTNMLYNLSILYLGQVLIIYKIFF